MRRRPFDADLRLARAVQPAQLDRAEGALRDVDVVLTRCPTHIPALSGRAALLTHAGRTGEALGSSALAVRLAPKCVTALLVKGLVHVMREERDKARRVLGRAERTAPGHPRVAGARAAAEAGPDPRAALTELPDGPLNCRPSVHADTRYVQAVCHYRLDRWDESRRAVPVGPRHRLHHERPHRPGQA